MSEIPQGPVYDESRKAVQSRIERAKHYYASNIDTTPSFYYDQLRTLGDIVEVIEDYRTHIDDAYYDGLINININEFWERIKSPIIQSIRAKGMQIDLSDYHNKEIIMLVSLDVNEIIRCFPDLFPFELTNISPNSDKN